MKILISVSAKEVTLASTEAAVKKYFKKFKHIDSDHWSIIYNCVLLCKSYTGRTNPAASKEILAEISEKVRDSSASGIEPDYKNVTPKYLNLGQEAFKRLKQIVAETKLNGGSVKQWDLALMLAGAAKRLVDNVDPIKDLTKYNGIIDTLKMADIKI